ncbi:MAG: hypothetical protein AAGF33_14315 [Pseudomonadota bacterium]
MKIYLIERDYGREGRAVDEATTSAPMSLEIIIEHIAHEDGIVSIHEWDREDGTILDITEDTARKCLAKYENIADVPTWVRDCVHEHELNHLFNADDIAALRADAA